MELCPLSDQINLLLECVIYDATKLNKTLINRLNKISNLVQFS